METFLSDGLKREYHLYIPQSAKPGSPLVLFLHWHTGKAMEVMSFSNFNHIADKYGFAVVYPQGLKDKNDYYHWNANLKISDYDDIKFLSELTVYLQDQYGFDKEKTFVTGISNGGFMSYTLGLYRPDLYKAIAPVIASMSYEDWKNREIASPIPILHICGLDDALVPVNGGKQDEDGWGGAPDVDTIMAFWAERNNATQKEIINITKNTELTKYTGTDNNEVWCAKIANHGHEYPTSKADINGGELIWEFFQKVGF